MAELLTRIYIREPREPSDLLNASVTMYIEAARKKSSLGVRVLAWAAYNRYHLTLFLYICVFACLSIIQ